ncbi:MAG: hypothetical protein QNK03_09850 [Myxococcota bacterium]|nr:hypothetical protein [Myxococcota bacterium]
MEEPNCGSAEASAAIWSWRPQGDAETTDVEKPHSARLKGLIQALVGAVVAGLFYVFWSHTVAYVVWSIAGVIGLSALLSPRGLYALIDRAFLALGELLGRALTRVLLTTIYYAVFAPFGALFRRGRRDPMKRFYEPDAPSYWTDRDLGRSGSALRERQY